MPAMSVCNPNVDGRTCLSSSIPGLATSGARTDGSWGSPTPSPRLSRSFQGTPGHSPRVRPTPASKYTEQRQRALGLRIPNAAISNGGSSRVLLHTSPDGSSRWPLSARTLDRAGSVGTMRSSSLTPRLAASPQASTKHPSQAVVKRNSGGSAQVPVAANPYQEQPKPQGSLALRVSNAGLGNRVIVKPHSPRNDGQDPQHSDEIKEETNRGGNEKVLMPKMGLGNLKVSPTCEGDEESKAHMPTKKWVPKSQLSSEISVESKPSNEDRYACAKSLDESDQKISPRQNIAQHYVFNWLNWAPAPESACYNALQKNFPGALPGKAVFFRTKSILEERLGFARENTLFGVSICPDEINNGKGALADLMKEHWGECFPLGGIGGAPFVGASGFKAFSAHAPDDGNIFILFGPHVAITKSGEVGKYLREGQYHHSTACGAVIGAYNACMKGNNGQKNESRGESVFNANDMQMDWLKRQIQPHVQDILCKPCPLAALAYQAYEVVKAKLLTIANTDFGCGQLVLLGGIQINMPRPYEDHFLPLMLDVHRHAEPVKDILSKFHQRIPTNWPPTVEATFHGDSDSQDSENLDDGFGQAEMFSRRISPESVFEGGEALPPAKLDRRAEQVEDAKQFKNHHLYAWLNWGPQPKTPCYRMLHKYFPGAIPGPAVHARMVSFLASEYGFQPGNTLFGMSICPDEINNRKGSLTSMMAEHWGEFFPLGGISGAPFVGKTGFGAFSHHVPDGGNIILLFGPHVGISDEGEVGKYLREGQRHVSTACGAVIGAYNACCAHDGVQDVDFDESDMQMGWIKSQIGPHVDRLRVQQNPMAELAYQAFEMVNRKIKKIIKTDFGTGHLVLVGGIQLNMPEPCFDHFLPLVFEVRQKGASENDIMNAFKLHVPDEEPTHL